MLIKRNKTRRRYRKKQSGGKPLNVAILFSGRIQGYDKVINKLKTMINKYNMTVYCSLNEPIDNIYLDKFCRELNIESKNINIEKTIVPPDLNTFSWAPGAKYENIYSMFYHMNKAFSLIERDMSYKHYDCVLYYRADINSSDTLYLEYPKENTIYIPNDRNYSGINDRMAYGNFVSMKQYCSLINTLRDMCQYLRNITPEQLLREYLHIIKVNVVRFNYSTALEKSRNQKCLNDKNACNL